MFYVSKLIWRKDIVVRNSNYDITTTGSKIYDRVINPFDLNISKNYLYEDYESKTSMVGYLRLIIKCM